MIWHPDPGHPATDKASAMASVVGLERGMASNQWEEWSTMVSR